MSSTVEEHLPILNLLAAQESLLRRPHPDRPWYT
jgi:hypothetical protein